jgi:hypothetical protein
VGIDHCGVEIRVPHEFLNGSDVLPLFQQLRCQEVAEGVANGNQRLGRGLPITSPMPTGVLGLAGKRSMTIRWRPAAQAGVSAG